MRVLQIGQRFHVRNEMQLSPFKLYGKRSGGSPFVTFLVVFLGLCRLRIPQWFNGSVAGDIPLAVISLFDIHLRHADGGVVLGVVAEADGALLRLLVGDDGIFNHDDGSLGGEECRGAIGVSLLRRKRKIHTCGHRNKDFNRVPISGGIPEGVKKCATG